MELARMMSKGQVTIPLSIMKKLNLKEGDKIIFVEKEGNIVIENSSRAALRKIQSSFECEAERLGLETEEDVVSLVKEIRRETQAEKENLNK